MGKYGTSLPFTVSGGSGSNALVSGRVVKLGRWPINEATVTITDGSLTLQSMKTDYSGVYQITGVPPGAYDIFAEHDGLQGRVRKIVVTNEKPVVQDLVIGTACNGSILTPVLLVPGIMGSSMGGGGIYPTLPKGRPHWFYETWQNGSWGLHDPLKSKSDSRSFDPGWRRLVDDFEDAGYELGCTLFPAPYDWRLDIDEAAEEYLEEVIDYAKIRSGMGKVNIVAHSMGGLVTRAYIQSDRYKYKDDIDKLAMVGTPNKGSANAYYLWQGGDPRSVDDKAGFISGVVDFYTNTINRLHLRSEERRDG